MPSVKIPLDIDDGRVTWAMLHDLDESRSLDAAAVGDGDC
jgi:hypothetical protein